MNLKSKMKKGKKGLLQFNPKDIKKLHKIIIKDADLLKSLGLLDYSLLLAVEKLSTKKKKKE